MEVSNEIKEDIRKTQTDLKNAIRVHQVWVARLQGDVNNSHIQTKVKEAEREIIEIGQSQKRVVDRLRRELELYQHHLKARNKQVNEDNDNQYVAQQLRDHQVQFKSKNKSISLLKPSVLTEIYIKTENNNGDRKLQSIDLSDSDNEIKSTNEKENSNCSENNDKEKYQSRYTLVHDSRNIFSHTLNKVKEALLGTNVECDTNWCEKQRIETDSSHASEVSPSPSPPPLPKPGEYVSQEIFLRLLGLITPRQKEILEKKRNERRKRSTTSTNKNEFVYGNYDMAAKRKKQNQFPYLQSHTGPPQTRSAKLRKQQVIPKQNDKSSREGSPSGSSTENKVTSWTHNRPAWAVSLPPGLSVEPIFSPSKKICHGCGRSDVPSLMVWCSSCGVHLHTGCSEEGRCGNCKSSLPDPPTTAEAGTVSSTQLYKDKIQERKRLQERNIQLCVKLQKLEARAASLKENIDDRDAEKRDLIADQIETQRNIQKLLDFISQFKETSISFRSTSVSESGSDISKSNED